MANSPPLKCLQSDWRCCHPVPLGGMAIQADRTIVPWAWTASSQALLAVTVIVACT
jgi:hypothetical protein